MLAHNSSRLPPYFLVIVPKAYSLKAPPTAKGNFCASVLSPKRFFMKRILKIFTLCTSIALLSAPAYADGWRGGGPRYGGGHGHYHGGVGIVISPLWVPWSVGPWYYPTSPYYPPSTIVVEQSAPPVYVEQQESLPSAPPTQNYWYYCQASNSYYPDVAQCPSGWIKVPPRR